MPPKRKSDATAADDADFFDEPAAKRAREDADGAKENAPTLAKNALAALKDAPAPAPAKKGKKAKEDKPVYVRWQDVPIEGEDEDDIPIYDDCNDIRRKMRLLLATPGFKVTPWLKEIGNINNNSYQRFMKATGPMGGSENGFFTAAYKYFEKVRIMEGKKKTAKRLEAERTYVNGRDLRDGRRKVWVFAA